MTRIACCLLAIAPLAAPAAALASTPANPCAELASGPLAEGASPEAPLSWAYANNDGICMARVSIAMLARHQNRNALAAARRAVQVAPSETLPFLARGLAEASALGIDTAALGKGFPQKCDARRLTDLTDDLAIGVLIGRDEEAAKATLAALEGLAIHCADPGVFVSLGGAIRAAYPGLPAPLWDTFVADRQPGGLSGAIIQNRVAAELSGNPKGVPAQVRRQQYRWLLRESHARNKRFLRDVEAQRLARALVSVGVELQRESSAHAGIILDDIHFLARLGGLHYLPVTDPIAEWIPWLATARRGSKEARTLKELEQIATYHEETPGVSLLALKLRLVLALGEDDMCARGRAIARAINRFAGYSPEVTNQRYVDVVREAAMSAHEAINRCTDNGFVISREMTSALERIRVNGQPFPVVYSFVEP